MSTVAMMAATKVASAPAVLDTTAVAISIGASPFVNSWAFNSTTGFGAKYSNPSPVPGGNGFSVAFSPNQKVIAVVNISGSPFISCYAWSASGFGAKYADPSDSILNPVGVTFNSAGNKIAISMNASPFIAVYEWSDITGFGSRFSTPNISGVQFSGQSSIKFAPNDKAIAMSTNGTPFIHAWNWDNVTGFGSKYANPGTLPTGVVNSISFSPASDAIVMNTNGTPNVIGYPWSLSGFGTKYNNPSEFQGINSPVSFSPDGATVALPSAQGNVNAIRFNSVTGFGLKYTQQDYIGAITGVGWSRDGKAMIASTDTSPHIYAYPFTVGVGFGTIFAAPSSAGSGSAQWLAVN